MCKKVTLKPASGPTVFVKFDEERGLLKFVQNASEDSPGGTIVIHPEEISTKDLFNAVRYVLGLKTK